MEDERPPEKRLWWLASWRDSFWRSFSDVESRNQWRADARWRGPFITILSVPLAFLTSLAGRNVLEGICIGVGVGIAIGGLGLLLIYLGLWSSDGS